MEVIERIENAEQTDYRPLPKEVELRKSEIEGTGLFAKKNIKKGFVLGMTHLHLDGKIIRTPLGGFYNHSDAPNCLKQEQNYNDTPGIYYYLKALEDIPAGEEITVSYTFYTLEEAVNG